MTTVLAGQASSAFNPALDVLTNQTGGGDPAQVVDVVTLQFRIFDISTDAKKATPVQVYPGSGWQTVDPTVSFDPTGAPTGVKLGLGHYFAPWVISSNEPIGDHWIQWRWQLVISGPYVGTSQTFYVAENLAAVSDPSIYTTVKAIRDEGFTDPVLYPDERIQQLTELASRYIDKVTGRWFYPKEFPLANRPSVAATTLSVGSNGQTLPQGTIHVASTSGFFTSGTLLVTTDTGVQTVVYQGLTQDGTAFTGCSGGTGLMHTGSAVVLGVIYPAVNLLPGVAYPVPTQLNLQQGDNPLMISGDGRRAIVSCELSIPICRLDALGIENQAFLFSQITWIELSAVRVFNRHLRGMIQPDDREDPKLGFTVAGRIVETIASGLYPAPRIFPHGRQNCYLFGAFGYTDPDPTGVIPEGVTPKMIRRAATLLVIRDLLPEASRAQKLAFQNAYRIVSDREGSTSVNLQQLWLKGAFTGDPSIDGILSIYQRPPRMGAI